MSFGNGRLTSPASAQQNLIARQNPDGGWPYYRGVSWTEPTVYALLALLDAGHAESVRRGITWLRKEQRADGGWPPQAAVDQSTWVTALVALLPPEQLGDAAYRAAVAWTVSSTNEESSFIYRLREWLLGHGPLAGTQSPGWPWVPGTAGWVGPTSIALLALRKECRRHARPDLQTRIDEGRRFLLERTCASGGWNHGSTRALGYPSDPYPETTGLALAALRGVAGPKVQRSLVLADGYLRNCQSADAWNWLRVGLLAHGQLPADVPTPGNLQFRTVPEISLNLLVDAALQNRNSIFE